MASPRLSRLHSLDHATIDSTVTQKAPGVYALDNSSHGWFEAAYIGRSDDDLNAAMHRHVGGYRFFKYAYSASASEAFGAECELYHRHKPSDNAAHPVSQSHLPCPRCKVAD